MISCCEKMCFDLCYVQTDWWLMCLTQITVLKLCETRLHPQSVWTCWIKTKMLLDWASIVGCLCSG
jgi:hypothetical protein